MKKWPHRKPADFEDILIPLVKAVKFAYSLERKNKDKDIPYSGFERSSMRACLAPIKEALSVKNLKFDEEDQGRTALEVILAIAIQLGIEQGKRMEQQEADKDLKIVKLINRLKGK